MPPVLAAAIPAVAAFAAANPVTWAIGSMVASAAIGVGATWLGNRIAGNEADPNREDKTGGGVESTVRLGADQPRMIPIGRVGNAGHLVYVNTYGVDGKYLQLVYRLGDSVCNNLNRLWVNGESKLLTSVTPTNNADLKYTVQGYPEMTLYFHRGNYGQTANTQLTGGANPSSRWTTNYKGRGICYVLVEIEMNERRYRSIPNLLFDMNGSRLYDWRKDTTNGGSGSHRFNDRDTWEFSSNPVVAIYNYMRGFWIGANLGTAEYYACGMALSQSDLSMPHFTSAANACDEVITRPGDTNAPRYEVSAILKSNVEHHRNIETLLQAFAGYLPERNGIYTPIAGVSQTIAITINDNDFIEGDRITYQKFASRDSLANKAVGEYIEPTELFEATPFKPFAPASYLTADNGHRLEVPLDLTMVSSKEQAERIAAIRLEEMRMQATATVTLPLKYVVYQVGDWIEWQSSDPSLGTSKYIIMQRQLIRGQKVVWHLRATHENVFSDALLPREKYSGPLDRIAPAKQTTVAGFSPVGGVEINSNGRAKPIIDCSYTPITDTRIRSVIFQHRKTGTTKKYTTTDHEPGSGSHRIEQGLVADQSYDVRANIRANDKRDETWTSWSTVTTNSEVILGTALADDSVITRKLSNRLKNPQFFDVAFYADSGVIKWTSGGISRVAGGGFDNVAINANATGLAIGVNDAIYVYWSGSGNDLTPTANRDTAMAEGNVIAAIYRGGQNFTFRNGARRLIADDHVRENTLGARRLRRASRNADIDELVFYSLNDNKIYWTTGNIHYIDDSGVAQRADIVANASGTAWTTSTRMFIYWPFSGTSLLTTTDVATARSQDVLLVGIYLGGQQIYTRRGAQRLIANDHIGTSAVGTSNIAALAVTEAKLAALAVTEGKLGALAVTNGKIGASAVNAAKIALGSVVSNVSISDTTNVGFSSTTAISLWSQSVNPDGGTITINGSCDVKNTVTSTTAGSLPDVRFRIYVDGTQVSTVLRQLGIDRQGGGVFAAMTGTLAFSASYDLAGSTGSKTVEVTAEVTRADASGIRIELDNFMATISYARR